MKSNYKRIQIFGFLDEKGIGIYFGNLIESNTGEAHEDNRDEASHKKFFRFLKRESSN